MTSSVGCATTIETGSVAPKLAFGYSTRHEVEARVLAEPLIPTSYEAGKLDVGLRHVAGVETTNCHICLGVGDVSCPRCDGRRINCTMCKATGRITDVVTRRERCTICEGRGYYVVPCTNCQRLGGFGCTRCEPDGHVYTYGKKADGSTYPMSRVVCPTCHSTKRILCPICKGNTVVPGESCPNGPDGWLTVSETRERNCGRCSGTGREDCDECGGRGRRPCGTCRGSCTTHAVEYLWRESISTTLGSWSDGVGSSLLSSSHRKELIQGGTRTTLLVDDDRHPDQNGLSALIRDMKSAGSPTLDGIKRLADREYEPNSVVILWRRTVEATTFDAAAPSWFGQFALIGDELVAAPNLVPPIDEKRKSTDELRSSKRQAAYAAWRPGETARRAAELRPRLHFGKRNELAQLRRQPAGKRQFAEPPWSRSPSSQSGRSSCCWALQASRASSIRRSPWSYWSVRRHTSYVTASRYGSPIAVSARLQSTSTSWLEPVLVRKESHLRWRRSIGWSQHLRWLSPRRRWAHAREAARPRSLARPQTLDELLGDDPLTAWAIETCVGAAEDLTRGVAHPSTGFVRGPARGRKTRLLGHPLYERCRGGRAALECPSRSGRRCF